MDLGKTMTMKEAVSRLVRDGDAVYMAGHSHLIPFAAAHEILRQRRKDLTLCRATPDIIYDQMIAAGCASKLVFSYAGNPGVGPLKCLRRAVEKGHPNPVEIEEYTHLGMTGRLLAGATDMPFLPVRTNLGSDLPAYNKNIRTVVDPYTGESFSVVPPLKPDVSIVHVQRCDTGGNCHIWGILGEQKDAAFAAKKLIITTEEIVDESVIRSDPNRTIIPDVIVDAVVCEPWGAHPSYAQGYYDRDADFYRQWDQISSDHESTIEYLDEWVFGVNDRSEYMKKMPAEKILKMKPRPAYSVPVDYGTF